MIPFSSTGEAREYAAALARGPFCALVSSMSGAVNVRLRFYDWRKEKPHAWAVGTNSPATAYWEYWYDVATAI